MCQESKDPKEPNTAGPEPSEDAWESDQEKRSYYYDDSHGYEAYDPSNEEDDDGEELKGRM